jgi:Mn2+/Fe2+ NRAMP family transporter
MTDENPQIELDRMMLVEAERTGTGARLWAYTKLSGPGWLQSAITLGGGSLAGSLYLGVLVGYRAMWWQPLAMVLGIVMLGAIGYVTLSTGRRPFDAINKQINPVLGWGWAIATLMANLVWCMPQYSLGTAALRQNLFPDSLGGETDPWIAIGLLFAVTALVIIFYDSGSAGVRLFEWLLKGMVAVVVVSFFAVVVQMTASGTLDWGAIAMGFVPDFSVLTEPSVEYAGVLSQTGDFRGFWEHQIVSSQQKVLITGAATAVGINMTFLLPYSMLRKGWDKDFRGLAIFDLSTGLFIPYVLATSCVVLAAAAQFHAKEAPGLVAATSKSEETKPEQEPNKALRDRYHKLLDARIAKQIGAEKLKAMNEEQIQTQRDALPLADRRVAAMIVQRDAFDMAASLKRLTGDESASQLLFGVGVLGMAVSTIIILMLINGFVLTEVTGRPGNKGLHLAGCFLASIVGAVGSNTLWKGDAKTWLAVPTSMFAFVLLPIAYVTFALMMNSNSLLGANRPAGGKRLKWNVLMFLAVVFATAGSLWSMSLQSYANYGFIGLGAFVALVLIVQLLRKPNVE